MKYREAKQILSQAQIAYNIAKGQHNWPRALILGQKLKELKQRLKLYNREFHHQTSRSYSNFYNNDRRDSIKKPGKRLFED